MLQAGTCICWLTRTDIAAEDFVRFNAILRLFSTWQAEAPPIVVLYTDILST